MQLNALDKNDSLISVYSAVKKTDYYCLECRSIIRLRGGERKRLHFFHPHPTPHCRLAGKSAIHLATQEHIQKILKEDCVLEKKFNAINRIADCLWISKKIVFEIQCSFMTKQEALARMKDYSRLGYTLIWILHDRTFNRYHLSSFEAYVRTSLHFYTNIDREGKGIFYRQRGYERGLFRFFKREAIPITLFSIPQQIKPSRWFTKWSQWVRGWRSRGLQKGPFE